MTHKWIHWEAKLNGYYWPFWLIKYVSQLNTLQLHSLLLVSNTTSTPEDIVLAVATKCHCSHSLKSPIIVQTKAGLGADPPLWVGIGVEGSWVMFSCHRSQILIMLLIRATSHARSQTGICWDTMVRKDHSHCRKVLTLAIKWWARTSTCNTRNLRWDTGARITSLL